MTDQPDNAFAVRTVVCQGCENECEVLVAVHDGHAICLGGNNCPTGAHYACAVCRPGR